jgi:hypothetical protein
MRAVFLYETTGLAARPFTIRGWETIIIDILNTGDYAKNENATEVLDWNILERKQDIIKLARRAEFVFGFPPCTDLSAAGAKHWSVKKLDNPRFQEDAMQLVYAVPEIAEAGGAAWCLENPKGAISRLWRASDYKFDPADYGGYLPENDSHPQYPEYIAPRDSYTKETHLWHSYDFIIPPRRPVSVSRIDWGNTVHKLGGKSAKTKRIRSVSPRGFFEALAQAYSGEIG